MTLPTLCQRELILGGQKSGKSRRAESLAKAWLARSSQHRVVLVATAQAYDEEMQQRIARHQTDRARRVSGITTVEEPLALADAITHYGKPDTMVVVDCLTLWLTNMTMPFDPSPKDHPLPIDSLRGASIDTHIADLIRAISATAGPLVLVGNEIGLGVIPMGKEVRAFVDQLGTLNQAVAEVCVRVTLMAAGLPLTLKETA